MDTAQGTTVVTGGQLVDGMPALYFEKASIENGPEFGLPQAVIDGHQA